MACPVFGQAGQPILHSSDPILFEIVEDGIVTNRRVSHEINAHKNADRVDRAQLRLDANDQRHADGTIPSPDHALAQKCVEFAKAFGQFLFVLPARVERGLKSAKGGGV